MRIFKRILFAGMLLLYPGCLTTYHTVGFEVLEPASITFPEGVRGLLVMDRVWGRRTNVYALVRNISRENGQGFGAKITPHWEYGEQKLYSGFHSSLYKASQYTDAGNWDEAFSLWKDPASSGTK